MKDKKFLVGAAILAGGGFVAKAIGAVYRIPLMNILGAEGMGVYQLVFPLYSLLLTFSSSAVPVAISRLVAESAAAGNAAYGHKVFAAATGLFALLGALGGGILAVCANAVAAAQGNADAGLGYLMIAPAVLLVAVISCLRGYFQGQQRMFPTAFSQIVEQLVKLGLGLALAARYMPDVRRAVGGAIFAVTISELAALAILAIQYWTGRRKSRAGVCRERFPHLAGRILKITLPVTVGGLILPFSQIVDSLMVINLISMYADNATQMYGLLTGAVFSLNSLPVAVAFSVAVSSVPLIAKSRMTESGTSLNRKISVSLSLTMLIAVPAALLISVFSGEISRILYGGLPQSELTLLSQLLRAAAVSVVFLSFTQTVTSCLQALGRNYIPVINLAIGVAIKILLEFFLLRQPAVSIFGAVISTNACYFVAGFLNLVYIIRSLSFKVPLLKSVVMPCCLSGGAVGVIFLLLHLFELRLGLMTSFVMAFALGAAVYLGLVAIFYRRKEKQ